MGNNESIVLWGQAKYPLAPSPEAKETYWFAYAKAADKDQEVILRCQYRNIGTSSDIPMPDTIEAQFAEEDERIKLSPNMDHQQARDAAVLALDLWSKKHSILISPFGCQMWITVRKNEGYYDTQGWLAEKGPEQRKLHEKVQVWPGEVLCTWEAKSENGRDFCWGTSALSPQGQRLAQAVWASNLKLSGHCTLRILKDAIYAVNLEDDATLHQTASAASYKFFTWLSSHQKELPHKATIVVVAGEGRNVHYSQYDSNVEHVPGEF